MCDFVLVFDEFFLKCEAYDGSKDLLEGRKDEVVVVCRERGA